MTTVNKESLAARIAELEAGPRTIKEDFQLEAYRILCSVMDLASRTECKVTTIPALIAKHGSIANACRETGLSELTIAKYRHDKDCAHHIIYNGRLMTHKKTSAVLYSRRGVTKTERANGK